MKNSQAVLTVTIKRYIKRAVQRKLCAGISPIVIASTGRTGSTMLTKAIAGSLINSRYWYLPKKFRKVLSRLSISFVDRFSCIHEECAPVVKTHDIFRGNVNPDLRLIFVFGDPVDSAKSVVRVSEQKGVEWIAQHIYHLSGEGDPGDIFQKDVLNYSGQIDAWSKAAGAFIVHYDDLWDEREALSRFLGFNLVLPVRKNRSVREVSANFNEELFEDLKDREKQLRHDTHERRRPRQTF